MTYTTSQVELNRASNRSSCPRAPVIARLAVSALPLAVPAPNGWSHGGPHGSSLPGWQSVEPGPVACQRRHWAGQGPFVWLVKTAKQRRPQWQPASSPKLECRPVGYCEEHRWWRWPPAWPHTSCPAGVKGACSDIWERLRESLLWLLNFKSIILWDKILRNR